MKGSLATSLVGAFGLLALAWVQILHLAVETSRQSAQRDERFWEELFPPKLSREPPHAATSATQTKPAAAGFKILYFCQSVQADLVCIAANSIRQVGVLAVPIGQVAQAPTAVGINRTPIKAGDEGTDVAELQAALKLLGYYAGAVDGVYSESTAKAVSQFQQAAGLNPDGIVSTGTWERLFPLVPTTAASAAAFPVPAVTKTTPATPTNSAPNNTRVTNSKPTPTSSSPAPTAASTAINLPVLRLGMRGSTVKRLQQRLQAIGLFKNPVDGVFGLQTETAVKAAQRRYRLKPDGVVGSATWKVLERQQKSKIKSAR